MVTDGLSVVTTTPNVGLSQSWTVVLSSRRLTGSLVLGTEGYYVFEYSVGKGSVDGLDDEGEG